MARATGAGSTGVTDSSLITSFEAALGAYVLDNYLFNGGFKFWQRFTPTSTNALTDGSFGPDRWYALTQTASVNATRYDTGGTYSQYPLSITQNQASAQRFGIAQVIEYEFAKQLRNKTVTFQMAARSSAASTLIRYAILSTTSGTPDVITKDIVNNWTNTTFTTGNFFISTNGLTLKAIGSTTINNSGYTQFSLNATIDSSDQNIFVFVWTDAAIAQNTEIRFEAAGLFAGNSARVWSPRWPQMEYAFCCRYYNTTYPGVPVGTLTYTNQASFIAPNGSTTIMSGQCPFIMEMRSTPTINIYSPGTGTLNSTTRVDTLAEQVITGPALICTTGFSRLTGSSFGSNRTYGFHYTANAEL